MARWLTQPGTTGGFKWAIRRNRRVEQIGCMRFHQIGESCFLQIGDEFFSMRDARFYELLMCQCARESCARKFRRRRCGGRGGLAG
jgi:hypothetical protein